MNALWCQLFLIHIINKNHQMNIPAKLAVKWLRDFRKE